MFRYVCLAALCLATAPVQAGELGVLQAEAIDVGSFHGIVYFTLEHDGYQVVATMSDGEGGLPVRFEATLTEGQKLSISVPGKLGEQSRVVQISRGTSKLVIEAQDHGRGNLCSRKHRSGAGFLAQPLGSIISLLSALRSISNAIGDGGRQGLLPKLLLPFISMFFKLMRA